MAIFNLPSAITHAVMMAEDALARDLKGKVYYLQDGKYKIFGVTGGTALVQRLTPYDAEGLNSFVYRALKDRDTLGFFCATRELAAKISGLGDIRNIGHGSDLYVLTKDGREYLLL